MRTFKQFLLYCIIALVGSSIFVDWNDTSFCNSKRNIERVVFIDRYEELNTQNFQRSEKHQTKKDQITLVPIQVFNDFSLQSLAAGFFPKPIHLEIRCSVKSFLHLLQLY